MTAVALFDLDDTLFAHRKSVRDGFARHLARHVPGADPLTELDRWDALEEHHYSRYLAGELSYLGQRHARVREFTEPFGLTFAENAEAEEWFETYLVEYRRAWSLYDDTLPCLDTLDAAGVRIGMISNGILGFQMAKLDALDLTPRIEHIVLSGEFGAAKPDPSIFLHACAEFGVQPSDALYVGDRLHTDAIGAVRAGLAGVWLDRDDAATPSELEEARATGVSVIRSLAQLPGLLAP